MNSLFRQKPAKAKRVYRADSLNPERSISSSMRTSDDGREYVVCLCLVDKTTKTVFHNEASALDLMAKYRALYKQKGKR